MLPGDLLDRRPLAAGLRPSESQTDPNRPARLVLTPRPWPGNATAPVLPAASISRRRHAMASPFRRRNRVVLPEPERPNKAVTPQPGKVGSTSRVNPGQSRRKRAWMFSIPSSLRSAGTPGGGPAHTLALRRGHKSAPRRPGLSPEYYRRSSARRRIPLPCGRRSEYSPS